MKSRIAKYAEKRADKALKENSNVSIYLSGISDTELRELQGKYKVTKEPMGYYKFERK